jgi:hypothetical protein
MRGHIVLPRVWRINDIDSFSYKCELRCSFLNIDFHAQHNHESSLRAWKSQAFDELDSAFGPICIVKDGWSTWMVDAVVHPILIGLFMNMRET